MFYHPLDYFPWYPGLSRKRHWRRVHHCWSIPGYVGSLQGSRETTNGQQLSGSSSTGGGICASWQERWRFLQWLHWPLGLRGERDSVRFRTAAAELLRILVSDILVRKLVVTISIIGLSSITRKMCRILFLFFQQNGQDTELIPRYPEHNLEPKCACSPCFLSNHRTCYWLQMWGDFSSTVVFKVKGKQLEKQLHFFF